MFNTLFLAASAATQQQHEPEIWLPVKGWPGYEVSNLGNVRNERRVLSAKPDVFTNRRTVFFYEGKKIKAFRVARLVALHFVPNPENKPCVNHKDGNASNDCAANLEWVTYSENMKHAYQNGLIGYKKKLTKEDVLAMQELKEAGATTRNLARIWGCTVNTVLNHTARAF